MEVSTMLLMGIIRHTWPHNDNIPNFNFLNIEDSDIHHIFNCLDYFYQLFNYQNFNYKVINIII